MTYGERLRELRAEMRLSLRQVEERGGPNKDTMSLIERDVHRPHPQTLGRIATALEMSVSELRAELEAAENPLVAQAPPDPSAQERREPKTHTSGAKLEGKGTLDVGEGLVLIGEKSRKIIEEKALEKLFQRTARREISAEEAMAAVREKAETR